VIAEKDIDTIFNDGLIQDLAKKAKVAAEADLARFARNVRSDVKSYFENQGCLDLTQIPRGRGRPRHQAERDLIQRLALTYLVATGRRPPAWVRFDLSSDQPFLKFVREVFECARLTFGNIDSFINEREKQRANTRASRAGRDPRDDGRNPASFRRPS
jgi:hypothetical protein